MGELGLKMWRIGKNANGLRDSGPGSTHPSRCFSNPWWRATLSTSLLQCWCEQLDTVFYAALRGKGLGNACFMTWSEVSHWQLAILAYKYVGYWTVKPKAFAAPNGLPEREKARFDSIARGAIFSWHKPHSKLCSFLQQQILGVNHRQPKLSMWLLWLNVTQRTLYKICMRQ